MLLVILVLTSVIRIRVLDVPLERDEGEYAYAGQLILRGYWPYQQPSLYIYKMPGTYFVYALILAVFGQTQTSIHAGLLIANLGTIILMFVLVRRLFGPLVAIIAAAFYSILSMCSSVQGFFAHSEHFVVLAALGAILLMLKSMNSNSSWKLFLSGVLLGSAFLIRQHGAAFILFAGCYLLIKELKNPNNRWRRVLTKGLVLCFGIMVPLVVTFVGILIAGVFDKFWFWTIVYPPKYLRHLPFSHAFFLFKRNVPYVISPAILIWIFAAVGLIGLLLNGKTRSKSPFILTFSTFSALSVCPGFYFRPHYFVLLLPAVTLLSIVGIISIIDLLRYCKLKLPSKLTAILLALVLLIHTGYRQRRFFFTMTPTMILRTLYGPNPFPESLEIAKYIKENSSAEDTIAILGSEPQIFFYAKRLSATGYCHTYMLTKKYGYALEMQKQMIREIETAKPKFIIFVNIPQSWLIQPDPETKIFDWFEKYQQNYYKQVGIVDILSPDITIYRWGNQAIEYSLRSDNWVEILQRKS